MERLTTVRFSYYHCWYIFANSSFAVDVFGKRFQKELEELRKEVAKWQHTPDGKTPAAPGGTATEDIPAEKLGSAVTTTTEIAPKGEDSGEIRERHITMTTTMPAN